MTDFWAGVIVAAVVPFGVLALIFISSVIGAACGALSSVFVSWLFPSTCAKIVALTGFKIYQLGAIVGFVGPYFKAVTTNNNK